MSWWWLSQILHLWISHQLLYRYTFAWICLFLCIIAPPVWGVGDLFISGVCEGPGLSQILHSSTALTKISHELLTYSTIMVEYATDSIQYSTNQYSINHIIGASLSLFLSFVLKTQLNDLRTQETVPDSSPPTNFRGPGVCHLWAYGSIWVLLCFVDPRVSKIRNEALTWPGIFVRTARLRLYYVASSPGHFWASLDEMRRCHGISFHLRRCRSTCIYILYILYTHTHLYMHLFNTLIAHLHTHTRHTCISLSVCGNAAVHTYTYNTHIHIYTYIHTCI